jgi:hypothetical protein
MSLRASSGESSSSGRRFRNSSAEIHSPRRQAAAISAARLSPGSAGGGEAVGKVPDVLDTMFSLLRSVFLSPLPSGERGWR